MKHAKKLLAVLMVLSMVAAFSAMAFAAPAVTLTVGDYADGKATVTVNFAGAVGLTSGSLAFTYPDGKVTNIVKRKGADEKAIGDIDNGFNSEFNKDANPAEFGFYFKNSLWSSAEWEAAANDLGQEEYVNGENFEAAQFVFTAEEGTEIKVTGELKIGDAVTPVNTTITIGAAGEKPTEKPTEAPTAKPTEKPTEAPTAKPTEKPTEAPTVKPTEAPTVKPTEAPTVKPTEKPTEAPTAKPTEKPTEAPTAKPTEKPTEAPTAKPTEKPTEAPTAKPTEKPTEAPTKTPVTPVDGSKYDKYGNKILGYDKNGQAIIGYANGQPIYSRDNNAHKGIILDVDPNNNGKDFVGGKTDSKDGKSDSKDTKDAKDDKSNSNCNGSNNTAKTGKTSAGVKTDAGKNTGDNSVIAIVAGVVALAGAAFVVTKKRK